MRIIYLSIVLLFISSFSKIDSQELYKLKLDIGYAYTLVEQENYIEANKQHIACKFGDDNIKPEYIGRCFDYIQNILSKQTSWPLSQQKEMSLDVYVNNQGQLISVCIYANEDITLESEQNQLISFFVEVSKWHEPFVPAISDDNNKIYGWAWASGAFKFPFNHDVPQKFPR
ncbi:hypothetical protein KDU71_14545 [Carboxylicivirga sediminis]|uniref:Uncharacterized protein n=1 Tax=Carboxylicivirga sediminis TaxID=2006564 RepID=A0A941IY97_9BACT|nr:hypothetical protein [Carboxylicivirga sediminis]MBR8536790.1 hypothetical protein [Carboxylicivirga sediminis]